MPGKREKLRSASTNPTLNLIRNRSRALRGTPARNAGGKCLARRIVDEPELISSLLEALGASDVPALERLWRDAQTALRLGPTRPDLHFHAARLALTLGLKNAAAGLLQSALALHPRYLDALILYGEVITTLARPDEGAAALQRAIDSGADYPDVHLRLGNALQKQGRSGQAAAAYRRALQLNQRMTAAREALRALQQEGKGANHELPA